jgi:hypothetical protein
MLSLPIIKAAARACARAANHADSVESTKLIELSSSTQYNNITIKALIRPQESKRFTSRGLSQLLRRTDPQIPQESALGFPTRQPTLGFLLGSQQVVH